LAVAPPQTLLGELTTLPVTLAGFGGEGRGINAGRIGEVEREEKGEGR